MNTAPELVMPTVAATDPTKAAATPRIKLSPQGFAIDHPDPKRGEQLMANALGATDRDAMDGLLRQLVRASVSGGGPDEVNISFMLSMVKSIAPRDSVEAMLVAQMVSVHVMAMRCAQQLASADDIARHDSAARALGRLARTFPAQIEALNRYRSHGEPAITVQNVKVEDGGNAIVGNVTQQRNVIVSDERPTSVAKAKGARAVRRRDCADAETKAGMSGHAGDIGPMLASPRCGARTRSGRSCRSPAVRGKKRCRMHGGAKGTGAPRANQNARKHGLFTGDAIAERRQIQALLGEARKLLDEMK
jgi:hypothetical protein